MEQMQFIRKLPEPMEIKQEIPLKEEFRKLKEKRDQEIADIMTGKDDRFLLIIGPCSADNEPAVLDYCSRLAKVAEEVKDRLFIVPRVYTNKPRTIGKGYKGMLHQPDPEGKENMMEGIKAIRRMHVHVIEQTGFTCAEEILYPENHRYLSDLLSYGAIGARSVEDQLHRMIASGAGIPVGMKNPTSGDLSVMMNSIEAAQSEQDFLFHGWEVHTTGNPLAHAILRGYVNHFGTSMPNYHYENLRKVADMYGERNLKNPAIVVDCNHNNSGKKYMEQIRIAKDVMASRQYADDIRHIVKGLMIESYIVDGNQKIGDGGYGKSITDPCLGWEKSRDLILSLADMV
ncbi:3-deoxy-7-phosphoheptulonate synthase [uncultured Dialister sp.]|uniref:3-deoxy-7-phosphoheptulonate synthase n=1 Tax=uncultured Dialister sp. TaxID=278064 RepID=UPI00267028FB|nr:3-deoxy-7-phosphoheptulonate synthase [uncultured Dialister sp.]